MDGVWPTVIICAVLALIAALAIRSYVKKLRNGCCGAGGDSEKRLRPRIGSSHIILMLGESKSME